MNRGRKNMQIHHWGLFCCLMLIQSLGVSLELNSDTLGNANYQSGKITFQQRCSACHTLADNSANLAGPNLWNVFDRSIGKAPGFNYSQDLRETDLIWTPNVLASFLQNSETVFRYTTMRIPEPVPENLLNDLIAFIMVETDAPNKPNIEKPVLDQLIDRELPLSERFPSFWNHLMNNTTHYRLVTVNSELEFNAYFNTDGSIRTSIEGVQGFWHMNEGDMFCYALYGLPVAVDQFVECFPVAAMAIPRFSRELWHSEPQKGVQLYGGIMPGRPER